MDMIIKLIPESQQRQCVSGCDWFWSPEGNLHVRVSPLGDWRLETLLALHETVEAVMCKNAGVTQAQVDKFDLEFDKTHGDDIGAGDDPAAPYHRQHVLATAIESILAIELGVNWKDYCDKLISTYPGPRHKQE